MPPPIKELPEIQRFLLAQLRRRPAEVTRAAMDRFGIPRQSVSRHLRRLAAAGYLTATGQTRSREYGFVPLGQNLVSLPITPQLEEDVVWREHVEPHLPGIASNILNICRYGVTEMVNNVIDHSGSLSVLVRVTFDASNVDIRISDYGIGIFQKIKEYCKLDDERHAIFELSKGKLTTDPARHTGEGIFFTSRMFEDFTILSGGLFVRCTRDGGDWLLETRGGPFSGTSIGLEISPMSETTDTSVFERYATQKEDDYAFSRTHVVVALAKQFAGEILVSRSQAKRVMARLDRFKEVVLNFEGIESIGPAFADEIFRVFRNEHPQTHITPINDNEAVKRMIRRAETASPQEQP